MSKKRTYKYITNNRSLKKMSKLYPYNTNLFANVYFHIVNHDYDAESLEEMLDEFNNKMHGETVYSDDDIACFDDEEDSIDCDDEDYLDSLYSEYTDCLEEYFVDTLYCDIVFAYKFSPTGDFDNFEEIYNETDRSKFMVVIVGIRFSNTIDEKIYNNYKTAIINDVDFRDIYNDIRRYNMSIIDDALGCGCDVIPTLSDVILEAVMKYVINNARFYIPTNHGFAKVKLDNGSDVIIETNVDGFFPVNRFKLSLDLNHYDINEPIMNGLLDSLYGIIIRFGNAVDISSEDSEKIELFKYDNDTKSCLLIRNPSGCVYLFLDGWKSENNKKNK